MDKARIYIDFNEMVSEDVYLLSKDDIKNDSFGNPVVFYEGMHISIYSDDSDDAGRSDNLIGEAVAVKIDLGKYPNWRKVKWCCWVDMNSLMHVANPIPLSLFWSSVISLYLIKMGWKYY